MVVHYSEHLRVTAFRGYMVPSDKTIFDFSSKQDGLLSKERKDVLKTKKAIKGFQEELVCRFRANCFEGLLVQLC